MNVERRANRATRVSELDLKRAEKVTPSELAAVFWSWLEVLEGALESSTYARVLPELRRVSSGS